MAESRSTLREYLEALLIAAIFLGFSNTFVIKTFYIPSGSMEDTLLVGDHLFVNRFIFGAAGPERAALPRRDVRRGDIVIFRSVKEPSVDMVKRCIGLPGDTVEVRAKQLFVNGKQVSDSTYAIHRDPRMLPNQPYLGEQGRRDFFGPMTVPADHYFCMGDNRDLSYDSRFWGPLPAANVKGRPVFIYWSYGGETPDGVWRGWGPRLAQFGRTVLGFFTKTRWGRTFDLIR
jgi:signal peptidase I